MKRILFVVGTLLLAVTGVYLAQDAVIDLHLKRSYRAPEKEGRSFAHLVEPR